MFAIDHAATALLIKRRYPAVPMAPILISVQAMELAWVAFNYLGIERTATEAEVRSFYRRLMGSEPPSALVEAQAREAAAGSTPDDGSTVGGQVSASQPAAGQPSPDGTVAVHSALTEDDGPWFADNGCFVYGAGYADSTGCLPDWWNGGYAQSSTKTSFLTVAPFSGDGVTVRMQYSGSTQFQDPVFTGDWLSWWYHSSVYNTVNGPQYNMRTHRWDILNATGDGFHWSYAFKWNCSGTYGCDEWPTH